MDELGGTRPLRLLLLLALVPSLRGQGKCGERRTERSSQRRRAALIPRGPALPRGAAFRAYR